MHQHAKLNCQIRIEHSFLDKLINIDTILIIDIIYYEIIWFA